MGSVSIRYLQKGDVIPAFSGHTPIQYLVAAIAVSFYPYHHSFQISLFQILFPQLLVAFVLASVYLFAVVLAREQHADLPRHITAVAVAVFLYLNFTVWAASYEVSAAPFLGLVFALHILEQVHAVLRPRAHDIYHISNLLPNQDVVSVLLAVTKVLVLLLTWLTTQYNARNYEFMFYSLLVPQVAGAALDLLFTGL